MGMNDDKSRAFPNHPAEQDHRSMKFSEWIFLYGIIGATIISSLPVGGRLRMSIGWLYNQLMRSQSSSKRGACNSFREEAWKRYGQRKQQEYDEEKERIDRIRQMQSVFNRKGHKYKRSYESWRENWEDTYNHSQQDEWYWKTDTSFKDQRTSSKQTSGDGIRNYLSHHYSVLGLERCRSTPYTDAEVKECLLLVASESSL